jgi:hypothetical protein
VQSSLELVPKEDLAAASALNGIEFNLARAVGPALAGAIISVAGVATAFVANSVSFFGFILVLVRCGRPDFPILRIAGAKMNPTTWFISNVSRLELGCRKGRGVETDQSQNPARRQRMNKQSAARRKIRKMSCLVPSL